MHPRPLPLPLSLGDTNRQGTLKRTRIPRTLIPFFSRSRTPARILSLRVDLARSSTIRRRKMNLDGKWNRDSPWFSRSNQLKYITLRQRKSARARARTRLGSITIRFFFFFFFKYLPLLQFGYRTGRLGYGRFPSCLLVRAWSVTSWYRRPLWVKRRAITIELTRRLQTNASRESRDECAAVAVSVTDFQASRMAGRGVGGERRRRVQGEGASALRASDWRSRLCVANCAYSGHVDSCLRGSRTPPRRLRLRFDEFQEEPLRRLAARLDLISSGAPGDDFSVASYIDEISIWLLTMDVFLDNETNIEDTDVDKIVCTFILYLSFY